MSQDGTMTASRQKADLRVPPRAARASTTKRSACADFRAASVVVRGASGDLGVGIGGRIAAAPETGCYPLVSRLPALYPEWLGGRRFNEAHGVRFPYVAGAMANGIATVQLVEDMGNAGMLGFFGAAGLSLSRVREAIAALGRSLGPRGLWGTNLISEQTVEATVSRFYVEAGVPRISVSASHAAHRAAAAPRVHWRPTRRARRHRSAARDLREDQPA